MSLIRFRPRPNGTKNATYTDTHAHTTCGCSGAPSVRASAGAQVDPIDGNSFAAPPDGDVQFVRMQTWAERDAALREAAVDLDA